jgi:hypothetical protein
MKIIIVTGRSRFIGNFYDQIINPLKGYFNDKKIIYETIHFADEVKYDNNLNNLYIGIFHHVPVENMPKNYIMLAMDPPDNCGQEMIHKLKLAYKILVYTDIDIFIKINMNIIYYPFPYHKTIENMYNLNIKYIEKRIDLLIVGSINDCRKNLFNNLKEKKYNIYCPNICDYTQGIFEIDNDILHYSSKIVLVNNYYKNDIQYPRMIYNASNKIFFIYILNDNDDKNLLDNKYDNLIIKCDKSNLYETIDYYLINEDKRINHVNLLYNYIINHLKIDIYLNI